MRWIFVGTQLVALVVLLWRRWPYPWFLAALAAWTIQAVNVSFFPGASRGWTATWWAYPEVGVLLLTTAATWEAIEHIRAEVAPFAALQLRAASIGITGCIVGAGILFVLPPRGDWLASFSIVRIWVWAYLATSLLVVVLLMALKPRKRHSAHAALLLGYLLAHAFMSPLHPTTEQGRWDAQERSRMVTIACCLTWITTSAVRPPADAAPSPS